MGYVCVHDRKRLGFNVEYNEVALSRLRSLPGAKWDDKSRLWLCSSAPGALQAAVAVAGSLGLEIYGDVRELTEQRAEEDAAAIRTALLRAQKRAYLLGTTLRPGQSDAISFLAVRLAHSALLGADCGTGKTIITLCTLPEGASTVVVAPATAKYVWEDECRKWRPDLTPTVLQGRKSFRLPKEGELIITNYDILPKATPKGRTLVLPPELQPDRKMILVGDEAHKVRHPTAARTQNLRAMVRAFAATDSAIWGLTGTPIQNRPPELWSVLYSLRLAELAFGSWQQYSELFGFKKDDWGRGSWGQPSPEVQERLSRVMFRMPLRLECGEPDFSYLPIDVSLTAAERAEDTQLLKDWREAAGNPAAQAIAWAARATYRRVLASKKADALGDFIATYEEAEEPLVVFSVHREPIERIGSRPGWTYIVGNDLTQKAKADRIKEFQAGRYKGMALTLGAGSEAITLTKAHTVLFVDQDYNPTVNYQAVRRCHRTGQTRRVNVITAVARNTVDREVLSTLDHKSRLIEATMPNEALPSA